jgi:RNA polymerase sigma-70 factor (ECF subfamily)
METLESGLSGPAEQTIKKQTLEALSEALNELTEEQQDVIALRFGYEMPIKDVAEVIGKSEGAVKQLQARAVAALSRIMVPKEAL